MFKKLLTILLIGLSTIVPVLGNAGVVKAAEVEYVKVQAVWDSPETEQQYTDDYGWSASNYKGSLFVFPDSHDPDMGVRLTKENDWTGYILNSKQTMDGEFVPIMEEIEPGIPKTRLRIENDYDDYGWNGRVYYCEKVEGNTKDGFTFHMTKKDIKGMLVVQFTQGIRPKFWVDAFKEDDIYRTADGGYKTVATLYNDNGSVDVEVSANTSNRTGASMFAYTGNGTWADEFAERLIRKHNFATVFIMIEDDLDFIDSSDELKIKIPDCEVIEFEKDYDYKSTVASDGIEYDDDLKVMKATVKWTPKITGKKLLNNGKIKNGQFSFVLKENDKIISETSCDEFGDFSFDIPEYDGDDEDSVVHTYTIEEKNDNQIGIDYDSHKETVEVRTIPMRMSVDYTYSFEYDDDGVIFENGYNPVGGTALTGKKILIGRELKDGEFAFELKEGDKIIGEATNKGEDIVFPAINYTQDDIGTHTYTISEKKESLGGVEYDSHVETVIVDVSDNKDGTLKADIYTDEDGIVFNNKYSSSGKINFLGLKKFENHDMDTFKFELYENDTLIQTIENDSEGKIVFNELDYTQDDIGEHEYIIKEIDGSKENVEYDAHEEKVKITVSDNGDGTLKVTPEYDEDGIVFTNKYNEPKISEEPDTEAPTEETTIPSEETTVATESPVETTVQKTVKQEIVPEKKVEKTVDVKTGDTSILPMVIIGICAAAGIGVTGFVMKKRKSE